MYSVYYDGRKSGEYKRLTQAKKDAAFWAGCIPTFELKISKGNIYYQSFDDGVTWTKFTIIS